MYKAALYPQFTARYGVLLEGAWNTLQVGRDGGSLTTGGHLKYEKDHPMANLHVPLLKRMGASLDHWADSTGELVGLSDPAFQG